MGIADEFQEKLRAVSAAKIAAAIKATDQFGEQVLSQAQRLAPVGGGAFSPRDPAPGTLKASGNATPAALVGGQIKKTIGFSTVYAAAQHERLDFRHDQGQAKYLETPMRANAPKFSQFVADAMKAVDGE